MHVCVCASAVRHTFLHETHEHGKLRVRTMIAVRAKGRGRRKKKSFGRFLREHARRHGRMDGVGDAVGCAGGSDVDDDVDELYVKLMEETKVDAGEVRDAAILI